MVFIFYKDMAKPGIDATKDNDEYRVDDRGDIDPDKRLVSSIISKILIQLQEEWLSGDD